MRLLQPRGCAHTLWLAKEWRVRAFRARQAFYSWLESHYVLKDTPSWVEAVKQVQRVFPGTESWLLSCSDAEGYNKGDPTRWVVYGGGPFNYGAWYSDVVGGPMQFRPSTIKGMHRHGLEHLTRLGYKVPAHLRETGTTTAWRSMLVQAIAAGWARYTGNDNSHWSASWGNGC